MHLLFQTGGQEVYKWLWSWVTASQAQLLINGALKGFLPGSSPCGGCKSKRLSFACIQSYGPFKAFWLYEVFLGPWWSLGLLWPFTLGPLSATRVVADVSLIRIK